MDEKLLSTFTVLLLIILCSTALADPYCGGVPLTAIREGNVSGDLWFDHSNPMVTNWTNDYTFPLYTDVEWAHLYVAVYCGNMKDNCQGRANITFNDIALGGTPDCLSSEVFNVSYTYPGEGGTGPAWVNDHCVRVTSDYFMWYNVTGLIEPNSDVWIKTWKKEGYSGFFDGRIKAVTLVVAYNDGDSNAVYYQVNQGHDLDSYYYDGDYIGKTNFTAGLPSGSNIQKADLTVVHMASQDAEYSFNGINIPTNPGSTTTPPGENWQGSTSGYNIWHVTDLFNNNSNNTLTYNRTGNFYKIILSFLSAKTGQSGNVCGDVNDDDQVNIGDVILLANHVGYPDDPRYVINEWAADVNGDDRVNIGDVILLANHVGYPDDPRYILNCK